MQICVVCTTHKILYFLVWNFKPFSTGFTHQPQELGWVPALDGTALPLKKQVFSLGVILDPLLSLQSHEFFVFCWLVWFFAAVTDNFNRHITLNKLKIKIKCIPDCWPWWLELMGSELQPHARGSPSSAQNLYVGKGSRAALNLQNTFLPA